MKKFILWGFLFFAAAGLFAGEGIQVISEISLKVEGMTNEGAVRNFTGIREGLEFPSEEALKAYLERVRQDLSNLRVFKRVEVADLPGLASEGKVAHKVEISLVDSFTIFPLPYPSYNSNTGLEIGVETHYDNALGTLTNWFLDAYLVFRTRDGQFGLGPWAVHPKISNIFIAGVPFVLDIKQDRKETTRKDLGLVVADWARYRTNVDVSTKFSFGGDWYYKPDLRFIASYGFEDYLGNGNFNRDYLSFSVSNSAGMGRVNWEGNLRRGFDANAYYTFFGLNRNGAFSLVNEVGATGAWYLPFAFLNYYGRLHGQFSLNDESGELGSWLRGIPDGSMGGYAGAFLNQTLAIDLLPWKGILDLQIHPYLDAGIVIPKSRAFVPSSDIRLGAGADLVLFIDAISNFMIRVTFGVDILSPDPLGDPEFMLSTSMSY